MKWFVAFSFVESNQWLESMKWADGRIRFIISVLWHPRFVKHLWLSIYQQSQFFFFSTLIPPWISIWLLVTVPFSIRAGCLIVDTLSVFLTTCLIVYFYQTFFCSRQISGSAWLHLLLWLSFMTELERFLTINFLFLRFLEFIFGTSTSRRATLILVLVQVQVSMFVQK